ncbi:MAG: hypothetical protein ABJG47_19900 [Ekhidna sp.]
MKQLISTLILFSTIICYGQGNTNSSFLTRNQPVNLLHSFKAMEGTEKAFELQLPSFDLTVKPYQSDFQNFMSNDVRLLNYPSGDLSDANEVIFGNYMNTSFNLGSGTLNTFYVFDHTGRLTDTTTSFSFGKKK